MAQVAPSREKIDLLDGRPNRNLQTTFEDWKSDMMRYAIRRSLGLSAILSAGLLTSGLALAQSGSAGGGSNFDGAWVVTSVGCGGTTTGAVMVTSGRVIGEGVTGYVSASGATSTVGYYNGITVRGSGHLSGRSGSGTFRRSDGCGGRWTTTKQ